MRGFMYVAFRDFIQIRQLTAKAPDVSGWIIRIEPLIFDHSTAIGRNLEFQFSTADWK